MNRIALLSSLLVLLATGLTGCGGYHLRGKVVEGPVSSVAVVDQHDPRLEGPGLRGASIQAVIDPNDVGRKRLNTQHSGDDGSFAIPVGELGAGFLEYEVQVVGRATGFESAVGTFPLPGGNKRVLITLTPGRDTYKPTGSDAFLDETLRMSEPYLRE